MGNTENKLKEEQADQDAATEKQNPEEVSSKSSDAKIAGLETKVTELNEKYLRLYSEFDNYRRRTAKEKIDSILTAGEDVYKLMLPLLDDFERAIKLNENINETGPVKEGFQLIYNKFKNSLFQKGLLTIEPMGDVFNADLHEAITNVPVSDEQMKGKVVDVVERGYSLNGKVIRFAKVIVGN
jgi:molecular chaperone GrpE